MGTKTIGIKDDVYERLKARKREDESFTDVMNRLLDETKGDWREGFGTLDADETAELEELAAQSRERLHGGLVNRQQKALHELSNVEAEEGSDETA